MKILHAEQTDPWLNLAVEQYLLDTVLPDQVILYIWQNKNTVVIGRNQNAWRECATELLEQEGGKLARRLSGGGAVFHDLGNLNFTFVTGKALYDLNKQYTVLLDAVKALGIPAEMTGRNDLVADGRKFSGNAFCHRKNGSYHHGTLLVDVDMDKLSRYLRVSTEKMQAKGVKSVRSRVVNLNEFVPSLTIPMMIQSLRESFELHYGKVQETEVGFNGLPKEEIESLFQQYSSWEWLYGEAPAFDIKINDKFDWGEIQLHFELKDGLIHRALVYSDAMDEKFILALRDCFKEKRLRTSDLIFHIKEQFRDPVYEHQISDIVNMLENRDL
ncbi:MAG TPA: lipoate--protein ligase [Clostridiales bacterium]|nr:lipoate--protein ligase [Clostridiales bacterium]